MDKSSLKKHLIDRATFHGFSQVGIARAEYMDEEARRLEKWLKNGNQGKMSYLENHFDVRVDPERLIKNAKSVISLLYNYSPEEIIPQNDNYKIARYAYGKDYHRFIKKKLIRLLRDLEEKIGAINCRVFIDSDPVLERDWAKRSGLGWIGKNSLLINKEKGSFYFLAELILDVEFEYDHPIKDFCGSCTRCIDACPTEAISPQGYVVDGSKCIAYLTIELGEKIPDEFKGKMDDWIFGCDVCQEVCPWNRFSVPTHESRFTPNESLKSMRKKDWEEITEEVFKGMFVGSAVRRAKYEGLKRNIDFLIKKP